MNPIGERVLWFVLGLALGWLACGWRSRARRKTRSTAHRPELTPLAPVFDASIAEMPDPAPPPASRLIDVGAARAAGFNMKHAGDLTVIEGIGPRTSDLLHANDVESFVQIAQLHVDDLLDILARGGPSFRLADPATWAQQASLAVENRWTELKRLQNEKIGGEPGHDT